jgi:hypothetical protein
MLGGIDDTRATARATHHGLSTRKSKGEPQHPHPRRALLFLWFLGSSGGPSAIFWAFYNATADWVLDAAVVIGGAAMAFGGWPTAIAVQRWLRSAHPYIRQHARQAVKLWRAMALVMMGLFIATAIVVIPACTLVVDQYNTTLPEFLFSWVTGWFFLEAGLSMALTLPVALIFALRAYNGPKPRRS